MVSWEVLRTLQFIPDTKVHGANTGPTWVLTWVLSAPDGPHVGSMILAIRDVTHTEPGKPVNSLQWLRSRSSSCCIMYTRHIQASIYTDGVSYQLYHIGAFENTFENMVMTALKFPPCDYNPTGFKQWGLHKITSDILQRPFSYVFSWNKLCDQMKHFLVCFGGIRPSWLSYRLGIEKTTSHYLSQWWPS